MTPLEFTEKLGISLPLIAAPMAGISTPELAAAVCRAGGLGMLAADLQMPEEIEADVKKLRSLTDAPFAVNLRIPPRERGSLDQAEKVDYALSDLRAELGIAPRTDFSKYSEPDFDKQLEAVLDLGVKIVSCSFGGFREAYEEKLHKAGIFILGAATTLREAKVQRAAHADAVILQGAEAGGPRLYFESDAEDSLVGLSVLIPEAARAIRLPLVASGGIGTAAAARAALAAGASAVMVGSAIACAPESAAPELMRRSMGAASDTMTRVSDLFSGRPERVMKSGLIEALSRAGVKSAGYPYQRYLMQGIQQAAAEQGRADLLRMPLGQAGNIFSCRRASDSVRDIAAGLRACMKTD